MDASRLNTGILAAFCLVLVVGVVADVPLVAPLAVGFALCFGFGLARGISPRRLCEASWEGIWNARFVVAHPGLIGAMKALWRGSGTVAALMTLHPPLLQPAIVLLVTFAICAIMSTLIGTAFGTAATAGCIPFAVFLYAMPLWALLSRRGRRF